MAIIHLVESPTGLVHVAPYRTRTRCGRVIDLDGGWGDLGPLKGLETPTSLRRRIEMPLCERCAPQPQPRPR